jgi:hypothetical protein
MVRYWWIGLAVVAGFLVWRRLVRPDRRPRPVQALILTLRLADESTSRAELHERIQRVDRALRDALEGRRVGEVEEPIATGVDCVYTCYGEDADRLFDAAAAGLRDIPLLPGTHAVRRFGPPGAPEHRTDLEQGRLREG